jgi:hypothetical protein
VQLCNGPEESAEVARRLKARFAFGYAAGGAPFAAQAYTDRGTHAELAAILAHDASGPRPLALPLAEAVSMSAVPALIAAMDSAVYSENIPLALAVQWEREGHAAWARCDDPRPLLRILVSADPRLGARAAAACARAVSVRLEADDRSLAAAALDAADAWGRGEGDSEKCYAAGRAATKRAQELLARSDAHGACALFAAAHAAYVAHASNKGARSGSADHAASAAETAAHVGARAMYGEEPDAASLRAVADLVRSIAGRPTPRG